MKLTIGREFSGDWPTGNWKVELTLDVLCDLIEQATSEQRRRFVQVVAQTRLERYQEIDRQVAEADGGH